MQPDKSLPSPEGLSKRLNALKILMYVPATQLPQAKDERVAREAMLPSELELDLIQERQSGCVRAFECAGLDF